MKANARPLNETLRLSALKRLDILDTAAEKDFDDVTRLAADICDTPISLITLVDQDRQWFKSKQGISVDSTPRDISFCANALYRQDMLLVPDALCDDRFKNNPMVTGEPYVRFYAGIPLLSAEGYGLGTLCVIDYRPRILTSRQLFALEVLGRQVQTLLWLRGKINAVKTATNKVSASGAGQALEKVGDKSWSYEFKTVSPASPATHRRLLTSLAAGNGEGNEPRWWRHIHREDIALVKENFWQCRMGKMNHYAIEYRLASRAGLQKWVLEKGVVTERSAGGMPLKMTGTHTDITPIKTTEKKIVKGRSRLKATK